MTPRPAAWRRGLTRRRPGLCRSWRTPSGGRGSGRPWAVWSPPPHHPQGTPGRAPGGLDQPVVDLESGPLCPGTEVCSLRAITDLAGEEIPGLLGAGTGRPLWGRERFSGGWRGCPGIGPAPWRRSKGAAANLARGTACLWPLLVAAGLQGQPGEEGCVDEDAHPAQAGFADEEGHGEVKA